MNKDDHVFWGDPCTVKSKLSKFECLGRRASVIETILITERGLGDLNRRETSARTM